MIKPLRKRHRQIWLVLAALVPAGILLGWLAIPVRQPVKLLEEKERIVLPELVSQADKKDYLVTVRTNPGQSVWQLEWKSKTVLHTPSAVIYRIINPGAAITAQELIGRIEARKDYLFDLRSDTSGYRNLQLVLYDFIHERIIDQINLLP